uniref:Uncharacterized protein n=1 Tax=Arundo donax TaxID=35708 RepID=A0A0A9CJ73_ARUDO
MQTYFDVFIPIVHSTSLTYIELL